MMKMKIISGNGKGYISLRHVFLVILSMCLCFELASTGSKGKLKNVGSKTPNHLINDNVRRTYDKIKRAFLNEIGITDPNIISKTLFIADPLAVQYRGKMLRYILRDDFVYYLSDDQTYDNTNAQDYGQHIKILRDDVVNYMVRIYEMIQGNEVKDLDQLKKKVQSTVDDFLRERYFIDKEIEKLWKLGSKKKKTYSLLLAAVQNMFISLKDENNELTNWVKKFSKATSGKPDIG